MGSRIFVAICVIAVLIGSGLLLAHLQLVFWNIPDSFRGWAIVTFDDRDCNTQPQHGLWMTVSIDQTGKGCTPSSFPSGWTINRYAYVKADGSRTGRPSGAPGTTVLPLAYNPKRKTYVFYVGTEAERNKSWQSEPKPL
jgi:hypothetical protein